MALFHNLPEAGKSQRQSAKGGQVCGVSCAAYHMYASAQPLDFLDLVKNCSFLNWTLDSPLISLMDGNYLQVCLKDVFWGSLKKGKKKRLNLIDF